MADRHHDKAHDIDVPQRVEAQPPLLLCRRVAHPVCHKSMTGFMERDAQERRRDDDQHFPQLRKIQLLHPCLKFLHAIPSLIQIFSLV